MRMEYEEDGCKRRRTRRMEVQGGGGWRYEEAARRMEVRGVGVDV